MICLVSWGVISDDTHCSLLLCFATSKLILVIFGVLETYSNSSGGGKGPCAHDMHTEIIPLS